MQVAAMSSLPQSQLLYRISSDQRDGNIPASAAWQAVAEFVASGRSGPSVAMEGKRVAVVGSGISGLSAAWLLHRCGPLLAKPSPPAGPCSHTAGSARGMCQIEAVARA